MRLPPPPQWWRSLRRRATRRFRRVPVVVQLSAVECGAACLAMILGYFGRKTRIAECRDVCSPGRDGVNAQIIAKAARQFGLSVRAFSLQHTDFSAIALPAIIHWNFNHFVVLERWSPRQMTIVDPAFGRRTVSAREFDQRFTGIVLICTPGPAFERRRSAGQSPWRSFARTLLDAPTLVAQILMASLLLQGVGFVLPLMTKIMVDNAFSDQFDQLTSRIVAGLILIALIKLAVQYTRSLLVLQFQLRFDTQLMGHFFRHLLGLPLAFFEQRTTGDLLMRLSSNSAIREIITGQVLSLLLDGLMMVVYLGGLLWVSPLFAATVVLLGLAQVLLLLGTNARTQQLIEADLVTQSEAQGYLVETLGGVATIKSAGAEQQVFAHWQNLFFKQRNSTLHRQRWAALIDGILATFQLITPLVLLWLGLRYVHSGALNLGSMLALTAIATLALAPVNALIGQGQRFQVLGAYLERLFDVLNAVPEQAEAASYQRPTLQGGVELANVAFRYDQHSPLVLRDVSLQVAPGQKVAIVGRSGSGKTTLAKLMLGLYRPDQGRIAYDGIDLEDCDRAHIRAQMGVVMQDSILFSGSLRQNIAFHRHALTLEEIVAAAQRAGLHQDIQALPMGYETRISEGSAGLSGGQRQRVALARALAKAPALLILDEATSHLDTTTERIVEVNLSALTCTRIVIAHRLSTIRDADIIVVMEQGAIVEQGTHAELLARDGAYTALLRNQLGS